MKTSVYSDDFDKITCSNCLATGHENMIMPIRLFIFTSDIIECRHCHHTFIAGTIRDLIWREFDDSRTTGT